MKPPSTTALLRPESLDLAPLGRELDAQFRHHADRHEAILIDCSGLTTIGSVGISRLVQWLRLAAQCNIAIAATNVAPAVQAIFDLTSLSQVLPMITAPATRARRAA